jgi:hypothetical protein
MPRQEAPGSPLAVARHARRNSDLIAKYDITSGLPMTTLTSQISPASDTFRANAERMRALVADISQKAATVERGGTDEGIRAAASFCRASASPSCSTPVRHFLKSASSPHGRCMARRFRRPASSPASAVSKAPK